MPETLTAAAVLLVAGPLIGLAGFYDTGLYRVWAASRDEHLATVGAHRRGWIALNVAFVVATVATIAGLTLLTTASGSTGASMAFLVLATTCYAVGGLLWCAVCAIRMRTTPQLATMVASGRPTEPGESLIGAASGGLFAAFSILVGLAFVWFGVGSALGSVVPAIVAWGVAGFGVLVVAWYVRAGDIIPAVVYVPTLVVGVALLMGGVP